MIRSKEEAFMLLGLKSDVSKKEVNEAYRALTKLLHPDNTSDSETNPRFYQIQEAYEYLTKHWNDREQVVWSGRTYNGNSAFRTGPRVFGDSSRHVAFQEHKRDVQKKERSDKEIRNEREERFRKLREEGRKIKQQNEEEQRKKESVIRAMKSIRAILAAKVIEDYLDDQK